MRVGGKRKLYIPYSIAYGEDGSGSIPPKSDLKFDCELVAVESGLGAVIATFPGGARARALLQRAVGIEVRARLADVAHECAVRLCVLGRAHATRGALIQIHNRSSPPRCTQASRTWCS